MSRFKLISKKKIPFEQTVTTTGMNQKNSDGIKTCPKLN